MEHMIYRWATFSHAVRYADKVARRYGIRLSVKCESGTDEHGPYHFRIAPAEVAEPCS